MTVLLLFLLITGISFAGSLQLGPVNLTVIQYTLNRSYKSGLWVAIGGSLPEVLYAWLAVFGVSFIDEDWMLFYYLELAVIPVLLGMGLYNIFSKPKPIKTVAKTNLDGKALSVGFAMGMGNPQLLPFWAAILFGLETNKYYDFTGFYERLAVIAGAAFGAFLLLICIAKITDKKRDKIISLQKYNANKIIGFIFIILAIIATINFYYDNI